MLRGIDVSHWDGNDGADVAAMADCDFVIIKATQGTDFLDCAFADNVANVRKLGKLMGVYHFADGNDPEREALAFAKTIDNLLGECVPVLDFEINTVPTVDWCESFIGKFMEITGIVPTLYISASLCILFNDSWIPDYCPLWVAGYPQPQYSNWITRECPYNVGKWGKPDIWQFTSLLDLHGRSYDGNIAYMDVKGFLALYGLGKTMTENELKEMLIATPYGNVKFSEAIGWIYGYVRDMQPVVFDLQKRVKELERKTDDKR